MLPILLFHRVIKPGYPVGKHKIWVTEKNFDAQLKWLKKNSYVTTTFKEIQEKKLKPTKKHVILTFDDGYEDNYTVLFPMLKQYGFVATIYMVTGTDHNAWGVKEGEPRIPLLTQDMIREMAAYGIEFGGHTHTHIDLSRAAAIELHSELSLNFEALKNIVGYSPVSFAYPFGGFNEAARHQVARTGYKYAVATNTGAKCYTDDPHRIRRIEIRTQNGLLRFMYKVSGLYFRVNYAIFLWKKLLGKI